MMKKLSRKEFIKLSSLATAGGIMLPSLLISQECELSTDDILGPYYDEDAPFRIDLAPPDEPGTRITISGIITSDDCVTPLPNTLVEVWHANNDGCYSIFQICDTGNSNNDEFHLRGKMLTNDDGFYEFHTIQPGHYQTRPKHFHIKFTAQDGTTLITQLYFEGDPFISSDPWAQNAGDRILPLTETENGLIGEFNTILNAQPIDLLLGDVNFDGQLNVADVIGIVNIILGITIPTDNELFVADVNQDGIVNVIDVIALVNIILNQKNINLILPHIATFEILENEIKLLTTEPIAGIQMELTGNFNIDEIKLENGWQHYYHEGRLLIINLKGSTITNPTTLFKYSGGLSISSIIVSGWNEKLIKAEINSMVHSFNVDMPSPNPFNPAVKIGYQCKKDGIIDISVFNIRGKLIEIILNDNVVNGNYELLWKPKSISSGVYLIKFNFDNEQYYRQVIYLK
jgi:catechol 1,2-dioxygenase